MFVRVDCGWYGHISMLTDIFGKYHSQLSALSPHLLSMACHQ